MSTVLERFLRYVKIDTQSDESTGTSPSTEKQHELAKPLVEELTALGAADVRYDRDHCYVYARIPATDEAITDTLGFIAHMDTSPDVSGKNVNPRIVENYDGKDIPLSEGYTLSVSEFPELSDYVGKTLITTDGTTLLGADDKAGVAEIMALCEILLKDKSIPHGEIAVAFTPDEEIGEGPDHFDVEGFRADYAYTVDGGALGEIEYENFNGATGTLKVTGKSVHPGSAKDKMVNASLVAMEFESLLPRNEKPEYTEDYEGFYHLVHMEGAIEEATLVYIIRDHDREKFEEKKANFLKCADIINEKYGYTCAKATVEDSYYNMKEKIDPDYLFLIDRAKGYMEELGITPKVCPIRGGTDGARLSFMGLPCPNLCTGGHNFHGRYEFSCLESMEAIVELLLKLATHR